MVMATCYTYWPHELLVQRWALHNCFSVHARFEPESLYIRTNSEAVSVLPLCTLRQASRTVVVRMYMYCWARDCTVAHTHTSFTVVSFIWLFCYTSRHYVVRTYLWVVHNSTNVMNGANSLLCVPIKYFSNQIRILKTFWGMNTCQMCII